MWKRPPLVVLGAVFTVAKAIVYSNETTRPHALCGADIYIACRESGSLRYAAFTESEYNEVEADGRSGSIYVGCTKCHTIDSCDAASPVSNTYCYPNRKPPSCILCGSPPAGPFPRQGGTIGTNYDLVIRPKCTTVRSCGLSDDGGVYFHGSPITIVGANGLSVLGYTVLSPTSGTPTEVVVDTCPFIYFKGAVRVSIRGITIICKSTISDTGMVSLTGSRGSVGTAPALLFEDTSVLVLTGIDLIFSGYVRTGILVRGGKNDNNAAVWPPVVSTNMETTQLSTISITQSAYRTAVSVVLTNYYGVVDVSGLNTGTKVVVSPARDPNTGYADSFVYNPNISIPRGGLWIINLSSLTNVLEGDNPPALVSVFDDSLDSTATRSIFTSDGAAKSEFRAYLFHVGVSSAIVLTLSLFILHQDDLYYLSFLNKLQ